MALETKSTISHLQEGALSVCSACWGLPALWHKSHAVSCFPLHCVILSLLKAMPTPTIGTITLLTIKAAYGDHLAYVYDICPHSFRWTGPMGVPMDSALQQGSNPVGSSMKRGFLVLIFNYTGCDFKHFTQYNTFPPHSLQIWYP